MSRHFSFIICSITVTSGAMAVSAALSTPVVSGGCCPFISCFPFSRCSGRATCMA